MHHGGDVLGSSNLDRKFLLDCLALSSIASVAIHSITGSDVNGLLSMHVAQTSGVRLRCWVDGGSVLRPRYGWPPPTYGQPSHDVGKRWHSSAPFIQERACSPCRAETPPSWGLGAMTRFSCLKVARKCQVGLSQAQHHSTTCATKLKGWFASFPKK
jgi:hypothetical protein